MAAALSLKPDWHANLRCTRRATAKFFCLTGSLQFLFFRRPAMTPAKLTVVLLAASLLGCAGSSNPGTNVPLTATRQNSGQIGNVTLADWGKDTGFSFFISGAPDGASLPLRLYAFVYKGSTSRGYAVLGQWPYAMPTTQVTTERQPVRGRADHPAAIAVSSLSTLLWPQASTANRGTLPAREPTDATWIIFCGAYHVRQTRRNAGCSSMSLKAVPLAQFSNGRGDLASAQCRGQLPAQIHRALEQDSRFCGVLSILSEVFFPLANDEVLS
jgi:hypothetical protein